MGEPETDSITQRELPRFLRTVSHALLGLVISPIAFYFGSLLSEAIGKEIAGSVLVFEAIVSTPLILLFGLSTWLLIWEPRFRAVAGGMLAGILLVGALVGLIVIFEW